MIVSAAVGLLVMIGSGSGSCSGTFTTGASVAETGISSTSVFAATGDSVTFVGELDFITVGLIVGRAEGADESVGGDVGLTDGEGLYVFFPFLALDVAVAVVVVVVAFALLDLLDLVALPPFGSGFLVPLGASAS